MPEAELRIMFFEHYLFILFLPVLGNHFNTRSYQQKCRSYQEKTQRGISQIRRL